VVVIGGGISGVTAALDLAQANVHVYLVEKGPSLGGTMAQLDKTFPTNDCSTCILSPKLVSASRHPNIDILTNSEVVSLKGKAPKFKIKILKHPRYLDEAKCTACGLCTDVCPVERDSEFDLGLKKRKAIYIPFPQAVPLKYTIDRSGTPPCQASCPSGVHAQAYIALISKGKYKEALEVHRDYNPLPLVCGRVCPHPCEDVCNRGELDSPIAIATLKRFMADYELKHRDDEVEPFEMTSGKKVAIIGSGPAGLTAAYYLAKSGHSPTIFESLPVAGGMLAVGIPEYRLPKDILKAEIEYIKKKGVHIKFNKRFGKDIKLKDLKKKGYDAVFLGIGAHVSRKLAIPGEDLKGVNSGVEFLRDVNSKKKVQIGKNIAVIGGGDVAIDAARVAHRLGGKVKILYRRTRNEMPAYESEVDETIKEGIEINYLVQPVKILGKNGKVVGLECIKMELGKKDKGGRRRPVPIEGSEFTIDVDSVIPAIGQLTDFDYIDNIGLKVSKEGLIIVDKDTFRTSVKGVFAAGDAETGPSTVVSAVGSARKAAYSIDAYLRGEEIESEPEVEDIVGFEELKLNNEIEKIDRVKSPELQPSKRKKNFKEVVSGISEDNANIEAERCLNCGTCSGCYQCILACEPSAIDFTQKEETMEIEAGSVIVATGSDQLEPSLVKEYGYGLYKDVLSALEFERMLSASGPTEGRIFKPSDGKVPQSVTFIQCVGSRDENYKSYCSRVCCMYAIKEAMLAKEHESQIEDVNILYMDIRTFGKGFEEYYVRGRDEEKINFIRGRVSEVLKLPKKEGLAVRFEDTEEGMINELETDMVILSSALVPSVTNNVLANVLGLGLDENGFFKEQEITSEPVATQKEGIYVCGCAQGPKDIPDSVIQASAAASQAQEFIQDRIEIETEMPSEKAEELTASEEIEDPRIGVFVCNCGINIGGVVDVDSVAEFAKDLPNVVSAEHNLFTCSESTQQKIEETIKENNLNRVVVAACTPRTHEPLFRETCSKADLNPYLFEMANIREHCSWVHQADKKEATEKAKQLIEMAVARSSLLTPLTPKVVEITQSALVIGGGISGIQASLDLSNQDIPTYLVEKESILGGRLNELGTISPSFHKASDILKEKLGKLDASNVKVLINSEIENIDGFVGNFEVTINSNGKSSNKKRKTIKVGSIIMAIGSEILEPNRKFSYGKYPNIITNFDLEKMIAKGKFSKKNKKEEFTFILCVGAREKEGYTGCSRYCCQTSIKQAIELVKQNNHVSILYRDIRTFGKGAEKMYKEASKLGIDFIKYDEEIPPEIKKKGKQIVIYDKLLQKEISISPDHVVLVVPLSPNKDSEKFQDILKIPRGTHGFFLEQHPKLAPLETNTDGIFLCGCSSGPKDVGDSIASASGAASKAIALLSNKHCEVEAAVAKVNNGLCWGCGTCVDICEFGAPHLISQEVEKQVSQINEALCKGCGLCAVHCPSGAMSPQHSTREQILHMIEVFGGGGGE
jgi:heterodisulfide reductase subunit A-like polyferredoxin